jgi:hypothetical protein
MVVTIVSIAMRRGFTEYKTRYTSVFIFTRTALILFESISLLLLLLLFVFWVSKHARAPSCLKKTCREIYLEALRINHNKFFSFIKQTLNSQYLLNVSA